MIGSFSLDGVSSETFSIVSKSVKRPLLPAMKVKRLNINGVSGAYDFGDDEYSLRTITMKIAYIGTSYEELRSRARTIAAWLSTPTWKQLIINDETDKYYLVKITSEVDLKSLFELGRADVKFDCQPFALSVTGQTEEWSITAGDTLNFVNPGTRRINYKSPEGSTSLLTIDGSFTTLTVTLGDETLTFEDAVSSKVITINSIDMEIEKDSVNIFNDVTGDIDSFLTIQPGSNDLIIGGTGINVDITLEYIPLWL